MLTVNDKDLHAAVFEELANEPQIDAGAIGLAVEFGIVTITGTVDSFTARWAIEDAVKRVKGVRGIANEIVVDLPGLHHRTDTDIAQAAANVLEWDVLLPKTIRVEVSDGRLTLTGNVPHYYQRQEAEHAVRRLVGVRHVENQIAIKVPPNPEEIHQKIAGRFQRAASFDARNVEVSVNGSEVTLRGRVSSLRERDAAYYTAWSTPGVVAVNNLLTVV